MESKSTFHVHSTGVCLGLAFADLLAAKRDSHGLVFGSLSQETINRVSDRGSNDEKRTTLSIQALRPIAFINKDGSIDLDAVRSMLDKENGTLIGWFSFRGNSPLRPSMKEVFVHTKLKSELFKSEDDLTPIFMMLTSSTAVNFSTHSFDCRVVRICNGPSGNGPSENLFRPLELQIKNLSHSTRTEYDAFSAHALLHDDAISNSGAKTSSPSALAALTAASETPLPIVVGLETYAHSLHARVTELSDLIMRRDQVWFAKLPPPPERARWVLLSHRAHRLTRAVSAPSARTSPLSEPI
jgi:hypothetical protein